MVLVPNLLSLYQVNTLEDLTFYIKNLTPGLTQVCGAVKNRAEELLHKPYAVSTYTTRENIVIDFMLISL